VTRPLEVHRLGVVSYGDALELQKQLVERRKSNEIPDQLLLLEHPPVITLGVKTRNDRSHVVATSQVLEQEGVEIFESGRGGDVTYHGPGQLVGYPIIDLRPDRCDVHRYVRDLEEVLIRVAADFGVSADRLPGLTGAWVGGDKLAAIGVRIARWVTSHGFALNVSTNLAHFNLIVPCGIADKGVTSLARVTGRSLDMDEVADSTARAFAAVFDRSLPTSAAITATQAHR
jgi:lipoyl(octanoyl) transferase